MTHKPQLGPEAKHFGSGFCLGVMGEKALWANVIWENRVFSICFSDVEKLQFLAVEVKILRFFT